MRRGADAALCAVLIMTRTRAPQCVLECAIQRVQWLVALCGVVSSDCASQLIIETTVQASISQLRSMYSRLRIENQCGSIYCASQGVETCFDVVLIIEEDSCASLIFENDSCRFLDGSSTRTLAPRYCRCGLLRR